MRNDDFALIQRILAGDGDAFESLIKKYQKQVQALAFRKVGDFQTAEDITTVEGDHRSQKQLKGGTIMTDEMRDESKPTVDLEEIQRQIVDLQEQLQVIAEESDAFLNAEKKEAMSTLCRLPHNAERPITWGYGAAIGRVRERCGSVSQCGLQVLTISYLKHRMPRLRISRVSLQIRWSLVS